METETMNEILNKDFSALTEKNKKSVIDMTKFLVITQNAIVPNILDENTPADVPAPSNEAEKEGLA
jgi:hypothetical protein